MNNVIKNKFSSNLSKIKWNGFFAGFRIFVAIQYVFFKQMGLNYTEIGFLVGAFFAGMFLFEIPSGVFADYYGRKKSLMITSLLFIISFTLFGIGNTFFVFLIANFLQGVGEAFTSGSDEAIIFDSLKQIDKEKESSKYFGLKWSFFMYGAGISSLLSSPISSIGLHYTFLLSIVPAIISLFFALSIQEPPLSKLISKKQYLKHFEQSLKYLITHKILKLLLIYIIGIYFTIQVYFQYVQFLLTDIGLPTDFFGLAYAVIIIFCGISSSIAHKIEAIIGKQKVLFIIPLLLALALISPALSFNIATVTFSILTVEFIFGFNGPILNEHFHKYVESHNRATIVSIKSFIGGITVMVFAPVFGRMADIFQYQFMLMILSGILLVVSIPPLLFFLANNH
ncbi:MAG: MFS transporter [archaeon]